MSEKRHAVFPAGYLQTSTTYIVAGRNVRSPAIAITQHDDAAKEVE